MTASRRLWLPSTIGSLGNARIWSNFARDLKVELHIQNHSWRNEIRFSPLPTCAAHVFFGRESWKTLAKSASPLKRLRVLLSEQLFYIGTTTWMYGGPMTERWVPKRNHTWTGLFWGGSMHLSEARSRFYFSRILQVDICFAVWVLQDWHTAATVQTQKFSE